MWWKRAACVAMMALAATAVWSGDEVDNGLRPKGKPKTLKFIEDLRFGSEEDDENYIWPHSGTTIAVNKAGQIFIGDVKESRVLEFDPNGKFVRVAIPKGQGPGELVGLNGFHILSDGRGVCLDGAPGSFPKLKVYDKDMNFIEDKGLASISMIPQGLLPSQDGKWYGSNYVEINPQKGKMVVKAGVIDSGFKAHKVLTSAERPTPDPARFGQGAYWVEFLGGNIKMLVKENGLFNFGKGGKFYSALSNRYEISVWDIREKPDGSPEFVETLKIKKKYEPIASRSEDIRAVVDTLREAFSAFPQLRDVITDNVIRRAIEYADLPPVNNPLVGMIPMEDGHLLAIHDVNLATRVAIADIFSPDGRFVGRLKMGDLGLIGPVTNLPRMIFRNGMAYTIVSDEDGENYAVRYRYKWIDADSTIWE